MDPSDSPPAPSSSTDHYSPTEPPQSTFPYQLPPEALALATRLFDAARNGQMDIFEQALQGGLKPNMTNGKGDSLIMLASYHGHLPLVRLLLRHGADPNTLNDRGQSPLAGAVFKNEEEVIGVLLEGGADPTIGEPSALDATEIFRQEKFEGMFMEQIERLKKARGELVGIGNGDRNANGG